MKRYELKEIIMECIYEITTKGEPTVTKLKPRKSGQTPAAKKHAEAMRQVEKRRAKRAGEAVPQGSGARRRASQGSMD